VSHRACMSLARSESPAFVASRSREIVQVLGMDLDSVAAAHLAEARRAWPRLEIADELYARVLAEKVAAGEAADRMPIDLVLAVACSTGNPDAIAIARSELAPDLRRALAAMQRNDIEARTREINHALQVIGQLQGTLDREEGGEVAAALDRFYDQVRAGLVEAQFQQSAAALEEQISYLMIVHEAWCEADRSTAAAAHQPAASQPPAEDEPRSFAEWNA